MKTGLCSILVLALCALGCGSSDEAPTKLEEQVEEVEFHSLSNEQRLLRASMVLRGVRPDLDEYRRVEQDPSQYEVIIDEYLNSEAFGVMVRQYFTEWLELDQAPDFYPAGFPSIGALSGLSSQELNGSIIQAAGRLAEHVVMQERPWSEIVTANYTLADHTVAVVWGLPYDETVGGWQVTSYNDGRPAAGALSDGWLFTRMPSTEGNRHRERASLVASAFICHDYPKRPIVIPPTLDLTSEDAIANAIEENPVCISCHHSLDPLAAFFAEHHGLRIPATDITNYPLTQYTPEAKADFQQPGWYGEPAEDLGDLGLLISEDPRFTSCTVRRFYSELMNSSLEEVPFRAIAKYLPAFKESNMDVKGLVRAVVMSPEFAATHVSMDDEAAYLEIGPRRATPQQLDTMFKDLTGYQWIADVDEVFGEGNIGQVPLLRDYIWGYRTLAGGPNNFDTVEHLRTINPTTLLVQKALAERAARHTARQDTIPPQAPRLLTVEGAIEGEPFAVNEQLEHLTLRLFGTPEPNRSMEVARLQELFDGALSLSGDPIRAWEIVLAAMFQDPRIILY